MLSPLLAMLPLSLRMTTAAALAAAAGLAQPQLWQAYCPIHSEKSNRTQKAEHWYTSLSETSVQLAHTLEMTLACFEGTSEGCSAVSKVR